MINYDFSCQSTLLSVIGDKIEIRYRYKNEENRIVNAHRIYYYKAGVNLANKISPSFPAMTLCGVFAGMTHICPTV